MSTTTEHDAQEERARRARVARVWAGISRGDLAARLGVSFHTVERTETGRRHITLDDLVQIGEACGVPEPFMRYGWAGCAPAEEVRRLERARRRLDEVVRELRR